MRVAVVAVETAAVAVGVAEAVSAVTATPVAGDDVASRNGAAAAVAAAVAPVSASAQLHQTCSAMEERPLLTFKRGCVKKTT